MKKTVKKKTTKKTPKMGAFAISCDWLQMHIKTRPDFVEIGNSKYAVKRIGQSRVFADLYSITEIKYNKVIATYCTNAREFIMKPGHGVIKVENWVLYSYPDLKGWVEDFFKTMDFKFIGFTRLDICMDIQDFAGGYRCQQFCQDYMAGKLKRTANRKKGKIFSVCEEDDNYGMKYQTIGFGSRKSAVSAKIYNKSEEQSENLKPWIKALHDKTFKTKRDVWRVEFGIVSMNAFLQGLKEDTDQPPASDDAVERFKYNDLRILDINNLYGLFICLTEKHFSFKQMPNKKPGEVYKKKRISRLPQKVLFNFPLREKCILSLVKEKPLLKQSSRSTKIFIKKMDWFNNEFRLFDENFSFTAKELIGKIVDAHDLHEWAEKQNIDYNDKEKKYMENLHEFVNVCAYDGTDRTAGDPSIIYAQHN